MTSALPPLIQAYSGAIGSAAAGALTYPLDLVVTRLQLEKPGDKTQKRGGFLGGARLLWRIATEHGFEALYDGLLTDTAAKMLSSFFYFYFYTWLRTLSTRRTLPFNNLPGKKPIKTRRLHAPGVIEELLLGFVAGVASRAISMPLNIVTLRLQTEREEKEEGEKPAILTRSGIIGTIKLVYKEQGLGGFWRGFETMTILSLNPSVTLAIYQFFRRALTFLRAQPRSTTVSEELPYKQRTLIDLSPQEAFFGAAISSCIAVALLYPIMLAKTRLQNSSATSLAEALADAYEGRYAPSWSGKKKEHSEKRSSDRRISRMYQGLKMQTLKGFLNQGVTFLVKERIEQIIVTAYLRSLRKTRSS